MKLKNIAYIILPFLFLNAYAQEKSRVNPPGIVVAYNPASTGKYLGSPSICILPDGSYLAAHDFFGKKTSEDESVIYKSTDKGKSWKEIARLRQFWSALFLHKGSIYFIGTIQAHNNYVIRKSTDGGYTWTEPSIIVQGKFHCAPTPIVEHNGRLWRALEDAEGGTEWPKRYGAFLISASVDSDLLKAESWTRTQTAWCNESYLNHEFKGWLEGNAVIDKNGEMANLIRVHTLSKDKEYAAIIHAKADGSIAFDASKDFIDLPGGSKKFTVRYDSQTKRYWTLVNYVPVAYRGKEQMDRIRNTLVLCSSADLKKWDMHKELLFHPDYKKHGFQYADWVFDGKDIIFLSRTAYDDLKGGAQNFHNTNYITFHRIDNFKKYQRKRLKQL